MSLIELLKFLIVSPMKEHNENEDQKYNDNGSRDRDASSKVALILSVVHSH